MQAERPFQPIDGGMLWAELHSVWFRCPGCEDGQVQLDLTCTEPAGDPELVILQNCTNGCAIETTDDHRFSQLVGAFVQRTELIALLFPEHMCHCGEPHFFDELRGWG